LKLQNLFPSVEMLGYSHPPLRDEQDQILVALDRNVGDTADRNVSATLNTYGRRGRKLNRLRGSDSKA
jgi:hypothetical protein